MILTYSYLPYSSLLLSCTTLVHSFAPYRAKLHYKTLLKNTEENVEWTENVIWTSSSEETLEDWKKEEEEYDRRNSNLNSWESSFDVPGDDNDDNKNEEVKNNGFRVNVEDIIDEELWLNQLSQISVEEVEFIAQESERADMVRQMQERGFNSETIRDTLGVEVDDSLEKALFENEALEQFNEEVKRGRLGAVSIDDMEDLKTVESHRKVQVDEETGEPVRLQMVYVDEHTCIGCTNCACIAQSTFFMEPEHGRARVFEQWGDDDETIQVAIETCPVDCIHYVPYDELKRLEVERRDQNINFKARLVSQGEYGGGQGHRIGGSTTFTAAQKISGNMGMRCNNCPSKGCANCPMFGVGKNPEYERKQKELKRKREAKRIKAEMEKREKRTDL